MSGVSRRQRADAISGIFVDTTRAQRAFARVDELMRRGWETGFCRALLMLGPARSGKTHIVKEWAKRRVTAAEKLGSTFKAVIVEVPPGCTLKALAAEVLMVLGDADPDYGSQAEKTRRIAEAAEHLEVDLIVFDEVQRLIDADTEKVKKDVANWLTGLLNRRVCPLLLVGEPHAERVFEGNMYLQGRTLGEVPIAPYDWHDTQDRMEFRAFLDFVDGKLGLAEKSDLGSPDTALRIHAYSDGRIGQATLLIDEARSLAQQNGKTRITVEMLADAVDLLRIGSAKSEPNPFRLANVVAGGLPSPQVLDAVFPADKRAGRPAKVCK